MLREFTNQERDYLINKFHSKYYEDIFQRNELAEKDSTSEYATKSVKERLEKYQSFFSEENVTIDDFILLLNRAFSKRECCFGTKNHANK